MDLTIRAHHLERFLDMRPKVFFSLADLQEEGAEQVETLCDVWAFAPAQGPTAATVRLWNDATADDGEWAVVMQPPATVCVLAARSSQAGDDLEQFRLWWNANASTPAPAINWLDAQAGTAGVLSPLLQSALAELQIGAEQLADLSGQLFELRAEYEQARVALESMQSQLFRVRQCPQLVTSLPPNGPMLALAGKSGSLQQMLPASAEGLAGFDLHFPGRLDAGASDAQVYVRLHALDLGRQLGAWHLKAADLGRGWVRCWLPQALVESAHYLQLTLDWQCGSGPPPVISLSGVGAWNELLVKPSGLPPADGALALTIWSAVPGTSLEPGPFWCTSWTEGAVEYSLAPADYGKLVVAAPANGGANTTTLLPLPTGGFRLHPVGCEPNVAVLAGGCLPGVDRVTGIVSISNPQAWSPVEFAMLVTRSEAAYELLAADKPREDPRVLAFSGWQTVPPNGQPHVLVADLPQPLADSAHLVFGTRVAAGQQIYFCWSEWQDVRLRLRDVQVLADHKGSDIVPMQRKRVAA